MDIYPQDLGGRRQAPAAVQARQRVVQGMGGTTSPAIVRLACLLLVVPGLIHFFTRYSAWIITWSLGTLFMFIIVAVVFMLRRPKALPPAVPLTPGQVLRMLAGCDAPLEREYLRLVLAAAQMPVPPEQVAQSEIREAVRALGAALDHLPAPTPPRRNDSAHDLAVLAAGLAVDADREADPVVAASLRRRAETKREQAETVALLETRARRSAALRQELSDEMDALHTSLAAFGTRGAWSVGEMADVAAGIGGIARKACAMAAAQAELDDVLHVERLSPLAPDGPASVAQRLRGGRAENTE